MQCAPGAAISSSVAVKRSVEGTKTRRPRFAKRFPHDSGLDALVEAYANGDYRRVRKEAPELASKTDDDDVKAAALELRRRIDPDPLSLGLMGLAVALLTILAGYYLTHKHVG